MSLLKIVFLVLVVFNLIDLLLRKDCTIKGKNSFINFVNLFLIIAIIIDSLHDFDSNHNNYINIITIIFGGIYLVIFLVKYTVANVKHHGKSQ